jgi:sporulation protein YlmC with PRC-barrel domain
MRKSLYLLIGGWFLIVGCKQVGVPVEAKPVLTSAAFTDYAVETREGKDVGGIAAVVMDEEDGSVQYVVLAVPNDSFWYGKAAFIESRSTWIPVPWALLAPQAAGKELVFDAEPALLEGAPRLKSLPESLRPRKVAAIEQYWQVAR